MSEGAYYRFIQPRPTKPRKPKLAVGRLESTKAIDKLATTAPEFVFYDLETTGLDYSNPSEFITNVGLSTPEWCVGIDLTELTFEETIPLWSWLRKQKLGGFNLQFDLAWPWRVETGDGRVDPMVDDISIFSDSSLWFRLLATDRHFGQKFTLEEAIGRVLQWPDADQQKSWLSGKLAQYQIKKDDMYKLSVMEPTEYTKYCALDAEASMQLHFALQQDVERLGFTGLRKYHDNILTNKIKRQIKATCHGIPVDRKLVQRNIDWATRKCMALEARILEHPEVRPHVEQFTADKLAKQHELKATLKKVWAKKDDKPWENPDVWRLEHKPAANLPAWCVEFGGKFYRPETKFTIRGQNAEWPRFNVNSPGDMRWLIYDKWLDNKHDVWYKNKDRPAWGGLVSFWRKGRKYTVELTKPGGQVPTGGDVLKPFGEIGALIAEHKKLMKLRGDFLMKFEEASRRTGYVHAQSKILGANATGRLSGGNDNS